MSVRTGSAGEFFVTAELCRLGKIALPTSRNTKGFDVIVTNEDFSITDFIQVKTNRGKYEFWIVNKPVEPSDDRFYVFVNLLDKNSKPEYFIVRSSEVFANYQIYQNLKTYKELTQEEKESIIKFIKDDRYTGWKIVSILRVTIGAVRQIAKENNLKIPYDRGGGENFPFSFTIKKEDEQKWKR